METINKIKGTRITRIYSAKFYFFKYITYAENDFYNMFPLVLSLGKVGKTGKKKSDLMDTEGGQGGGDTLFRGLDFHYLPMEMRLPLLDELEKINPNMHRQPVQFAKFFRKLMWNVRKYRPARVCYKHYKIKNIRGGKIIRIERNDWRDILMEPRIEKFVTSSLGTYSSERVWKNSLKQMRL